MKKSAARKSKFQAALFFMSDGAQATDTAFSIGLLAFME